MEWTNLTTYNPYLRLSHCSAIYNAIMPSGLRSNPVTTSSTGSSPSAITSPVLGLVGNLAHDYPLLTTSRQRCARVSPAANVDPGVSLDVSYRVGTHETARLLDPTLSQGKLSVYNPLIPAKTARPHQ